MAEALFSNAGGNKYVVLLCGRHHNQLDFLTEYQAEIGGDLTGGRQLKSILGESVEGVLMPLELNVFGHLVGRAGFKPIVDHFQNAASEFAEPVLDGILELPRGFWCDRLKQERLHELVELLQLQLSSRSRFFPNAMHILSNQTYQKSENRLRSCIEASFPEYLFVFPLKFAYSRRERLFFVIPVSADLPTKPTNIGKTLVLLGFPSNAGIAPFGLKPFPAFPPGGMIGLAEKMSADYK